MITTDWRLPDAPLRASAVATKAVGLVSLVCVAWGARRGLPVGDLYPLKAAAAFAGVMLVSLGFLQRHHPFARFGPANQTTTVRAVLVALIVSLIGEPRLPIVASAAVAGGLVVTALDGVDGWLARRNGIASEFGARFDMEIDALLILALSILVWQFEKAGAWVVASGLLRYAFVAAGAQSAWLHAPLPPSRRRQAICVVQIGALLLALVPVVGPALSNPLAAVALATLTGSFLIDTLWLARHAG